LLRVRYARAGKHADPKGANERSSFHLLNQLVDE
jgi:hypothetical protein